VRLEGRVTAKCLLDQFRFVTRDDVDDDPSDRFIPESDSQS
jgi:hypothetical protein